jgi:hypothetical protein
VIDHLLDHLPNRFQKSYAMVMVIPASLWNKDDYDPKELARYNAIGPGCLDQMGKEPTIIPIAGAFLPSYGSEPVFYMLGTHSGSTCRLAV